MAHIQRERIVITGMGLVTPLGSEVEAVWQRLVSSHSGIRRLPEEIVPDIEAKIGGTVLSIHDDPHGFDINKAIPHKEQKKMDRFIHFAIEAARQAIEQSDWHPSTNFEKSRTATIIASGIGGFPVITEAVKTVETKGSKRLSPFTIPAFLVNLAAGHVSIRHGFKGPIGAPVTACAASAQAIGDGMRMLLTGEADVAVCGGAEACLERVALGGFAAARALSTSFNDSPDKASRPFDQSRDGFVMGEGAGVVVLETLSHAVNRGATIIAELVGYGTSADAHHITSGPEDGEGAQRSMISAIAMAGIEPPDIDYINAHSTSTPVGDKSEIAAIKAVFGKDAGPAISSTKSAVGHLLGAAGAVEAIFSILALRDGLLPPTLNLDNKDEDAYGLDIIGPIARKKEISYALSNGFGFGGVNATLIFKKYRS
ncbi:MAG: beta-ketoacyl-ACP synthase II [Micavibrio sp.]|nr:beta-ketoacyl-ACP synthase II [Micavibrio sp.]